MGTELGRLGVVEFATTGSDLDTGRIVAARVEILDADGAELVRWDWGSDRADAVVGEVAQTLRTLLVLGVPIAVYDAAAGLTILDRECRRRGIPPLGSPAPVLDPLVLDHVVEPRFGGSRALSSLAERYGVEPGSLVAGRLVRAMCARDDLLGTPATLHARQRELLDDWPVVPLDDIRLIEDTQPFPAPPPRPSDTVPMFDFSDTGMLALGAGSSEDAPPAAAEPMPVFESDALPPAPVSAPPPPAPAPVPRRIHVAAAIVTDPDGRAVVVRKRGTTGYMQPGGKIERGESALTALVRELREELGLEVDVDATEFLGSFEADALNEPGARVRAEVFALETDAPLHPSGEIDDVRWLESPDDTDAVELAPLTVDVLVPLWASRRRPALF